jgi:type II secretion system protein I
MMARRLPLRRSSAGFTLIEVLAALVIFSVAMMGFIQTTGESARIQANLMTLQRAEMLAQNVLEEMRYGNSFEIGTDDGDFKGEDAMFHWGSDVEADPNTDNLLDVTVTVSWNDGIERETQIMTQIAQEPKQQ